MSKKVAVLVVNPVNGAGLFQYLEAFFENGISFWTFAVADSVDVKSNSGVALKADDVVAALRGREAEYDALVFACGDAMPKFGENAGKHYNQDMLAVIKAFGDAEKMVVGHCVGALMFDSAGIGRGREVAIHPFVKGALMDCVGTDNPFVVAGNLYTAQTEKTLATLIPKVIAALK